MDVDFADGWILLIRACYDGDLVDCACCEGIHALVVVVRCATCCSQPFEGLLAYNGVTRLVELQSLLQFEELQSLLQFEFKVRSVSYHATVQE